jgi:hypothetical protein
MSGYRGNETTGFQSPAEDYVEAAVDLRKSSICAARAVMPSELSVMSSGRGASVTGIF